MFRVVIILGRSRPTLQHYHGVAVRFAPKTMLLRGLNPVLDLQSSHILKIRSNNVEH